MKKILPLLFILSFKFSNAQWQYCLDYDTTFSCNVSNIDKIGSGIYISSIESSPFGIYASFCKAVTTNDSGVTFSATGYNDLPWCGTYEFEKVGNSIFAATDSGVFMSVNNGVNWTFANNGINDTNIRCLAYIGGNLLAGTDDHGTFVSSNNGSSWTPATGCNPNLKCYLVAGSTVYAGTSAGGICKSLNNGVSWTYSSSGLPAGIFVFSLHEAGGAIYAGTDYGVYKSINNGSSWVAVNNGLPNNIYVRDIVSSGNSIICALFGDGVYLSTNGGLNWFAMNTGLGSVPSSTSLLVDSPYIYMGTGYGWGGSLYRRLISDFTTNISEYDNIQGFHIYPNPSTVNKNSIIKFDTPITNNNTLLQVSNTLGQVVFAQQLNYNSTEVELKNLIGGSYIVKLIGNDSQYIQKLVVLKE